MRKNRILCMLGAAALLLGGVSCSDDAMVTKPDHSLLSPESTGGVYLSVDFKMPAGSASTRSETVEGGGSSAGTEIGSDAENYVSSALIVLASSVEKTLKNGKIDKYGFIVAGEVQDNRIAALTSTGDNTNKQYRATACLQKDNLNSFYESFIKENEQGEFLGYEIPEVYVFVFCNPNKQLTDMFSASGDMAFGSSEWIDKTCTVLQSNDGTNENIGIWSANSFLMNNVSTTTRLLPENLLDWENYTSIDKPFHLSQNNVGSVNNEEVDENGRGAVKVERSVARFDFKDGSSSDTEPNTYNVIFMTKEDGNIDDSKPIIAVELQKMCLVNMCNSFYYLPRVSDNGTMEAGADVILCGKEKPWLRQGGVYTGGNYVVGPYANVFGAETPLKKDFSTYMNFAFFEDDGTFNEDNMNSTSRWDVVKVSSVLEGRGDNYEGTGNTEGSSITHKPGDYKVWRYVTENVIPINANKQMNGVSTGIVFKGKLKGTDLALAGNDLYEESWNKGYIQNLAKCLNGEKFTFNGVDHDLTGDSKDDPILYSFNGRVYMGWRHIRQAAIQNSITINTAGGLEINSSNSLYKAVFGDGPIPPSYSGSTADQPKYYIYYDAKGEPHDVIDPLWNSDPESAAYEDYLKSPNYAWSVWARDDEREVIDDNQKPTESLIAMRKAVVDAGITIYQSSKDADFGEGYYCYYYYWNRHNDNRLNGTMAPMEFSVVRNNVYKLSVDKIARLGHPRIPSNDPDSPTPETPDESDEIYLDVKLEIVPWVVRLNSIEF